MLEGWKERAAQRFLDSLRESRNVPFERVLFAIGIRYVGETTARDIARHFGDIDTLAQASKEELAAVPEVGEVIAESVYKYFRDERHLKEIERLKAAGLQMSVVRKAENASDALAGKTIVISGNFSVSRDEMKALIEANGGKNSGSVSGKTAFLLAGAKPGPEKLRKAETLGVAVISEDDLYGMVPRPDGPATAPVPEDGELTLF
jgi:DNA ligase (NAD+)